MKHDLEGSWHKIGLGMAGLLLLSSFAVHAGDNMLFRGALVAEACVIPPGEENLQLDFGTVIDKYLYLNQRTLGQPFAIHLTTCDLSQANTLTVTFSGNENRQLPGLLALDSSSQANGIAVGIETRQGKPLPLNLAGQKSILMAGSNLIAFKAYIQGEPEAIAQKTIERGPFSAVATFRLEYE